MCSDMDHTAKMDKQIRTAIYRGDITWMKSLLADTSYTKITLLDEPGLSILAPNQLECLTLVMNDERFVFDDEFVTGYLYFSSRELSDTVLLHPRARPWLNNPQKIYDDFTARFGKFLLSRHVGYWQRYGNAYPYIKKLSIRHKNQRTAFILYPALKLHVRNFIHRRYMPGGPGYNAINKSDFAAKN